MSNVTIGFTSTMADKDTLQSNVAISASPNLKRGPLVDDGAPYSAIGMNELQFLLNKSKSSDVPIEDKPCELSKYDFWQYGTG